MLGKIWKQLRLPKFIQVLIMRAINDQFLIGVTGVIFNDKFEILILKHTYRQIQWSLPGGYLKTHEHPKEGLAREIKEETGFEVKIIRIISTKNIDSKARLDMSYYGIFLGGTFKKNDEIIDFGFFSEDKLPKLIPDQYDIIKKAVDRKREHARYIQWMLFKNKLHRIFKR